MPLSAKDAAPSLVAPTDHRTPDEERAQFHLPPGFSAQLVAAEPEITKPMNIAFDARGRLWVTCTIEYPWPAEPGKGRDTVRILSDFGPDGRARKVETFAEGLNIPLGILPYGNGAIVYSIPRISYYEDTNGDGKADKVTPLVGDFGNVDTHGMTNNFVRGFDGFVYANHGFRNDSHLKGTDGAELSMNSGNTYRFHPDGTGLQLFAAGQVNPFGLCLDPLGDLFSADCHTKPQYLLLHGAVYPSFGKPDDGLGYGPVMCEHAHGSTGIAGTLYYAAEQFPAAYRGNLFNGNPVTSIINRDRVEWKGSSPTAVAEPDFLVSDDPWFRPVQTMLGPDGAMYVADFYNKIIGHYEVDLKHPGRDRASGRIWRIVYTGPDGGPLQTPPDLTKLDSAGLVRLLADPNLKVRTLAMHRLMDTLGQAPSAMPDLAAAATNWQQRCHALWVAESLGKAGKPVVDQALRDEKAPPEVRIHLARILTARKELDAEAEKAALKLIADSDPRVRRVAADLVLTHPQRSFLEPVIAVLQSADPADGHLVQALHIALRAVVRQNDVLAAFNSFDAGRQAVLVEAVLGIQSPPAARCVVGYLASQCKDPAAGDRLVRHAFANLETPDDQAAAVAAAQRVAGSDNEAALKLIEASRAGWAGKPACPPAPALVAWAEKVVPPVLKDEHASAETRRRSIAMAATFGLRTAADSIAAVLANPKSDKDLVKLCIEALPTINPQKAAGQLLSHLNDSRLPIDLREQAATTLGTIKDAAASPEAVAALVTAPHNVQRSLALAMAGSPAGAEALLTAVKDGKGSPQLLVDKAVRAKLSATGIVGLDERIAELTKGVAEKDDQLQKKIDKRAKAFANKSADPGSIERGHALFAKTCAVCHRIADEGAQIGPSLDGVAKRGVDRVVEDVLDPSRNVDAAFRYSILTLSDGDVKTGLFRRQEGKAMIFADEQGKEFSLPAETVSKKTESKLSLMPSNFVDLIPEQDFQDLLAFLMSQQEVPKR